MGPSGVRYRVCSFAHHQGNRVLLNNVNPAAALLLPCCCPAAAPASAAGNDFFSTHALPRKREQHHTEPVSGLYVPAVLVCKASETPVLICYSNYLGRKKMPQCLQLSSTTHSDRRQTEFYEKQRLNAFCLRRSSFF